MFGKSKATKPVKAKQVVKSKVVKPTQKATKNKPTKTITQKQEQLPKDIVKVRNQPAKQQLVKQSQPTTQATAKPKRRVKSITITYAD